MSSQNPSTQVGPDQPHTPPRQPVPRPLRRDGAFCFQGLTPAEQAMEEAMMASSSPPPELVLGKRRRSVNEPVDGGDTEPEEQGSSIAPPQSELPSITNVAATVRRYAAIKKLRPEQRDEVDAFLSVSIIILWRSCLLKFGSINRIMLSADRPNCLYVCLHLEVSLTAFDQQRLRTSCQRN
jgi:hypothetical protein